LDTSTLYTLGFFLAVTGVVIVVITVLLILLSGTGKAKTRGAGVIMIGPIPIVFGTDKESVKKVLILAITLSVVMIILTIVMHFMSR
jgi:uncharacterized protein (TIGR00304 family)